MPAMASTGNSLRTLQAGALIACALLAACSKKEAEKPAPAPTEVSVQTVKAQLVPITYDFVGQTESSQQVEIRARVDGFLEKRVYTEGSFVKAGQVLFQIDPKPFNSDLKAAQAELAQQQARLSTARANLRRVKPLVADNALAAKDLDDATGSEQAAAAAVEAARAKVTDASLNVGYATITSPLDGLSSFAKVQDGAYVNGQNSLLTYVAKLDPMRVNFSLSENESLRMHDEVASGKLLRTPRNDYAVELLMADGTSYPAQGRITFFDAAFSQDTGTFLLRAEVPNREGVLRPGQFVRVRVHGLQRPNAIVVPQRAVQQGPRGAFVWTVDAENKVLQQPVTAGDWLGDQWLVSRGLKDGDRVVVDGFMRLAPGAPVRVKEVAAEPLPVAAVAASPGTAATGRSGAAPAGAGDTTGAAVSGGAAGAGTAPAPAAPAATAPGPATAPGTEAVYFDPARTTLDATGRAHLLGVAATLKAKPDARVALHGFVDASGNPQANAQLAKARAQAVRDALVAAGVPRERIDMQAPTDIVGGQSPALARRVDVVVAGAR
ncbi:efflux RND transporter periplasmic adaptor subunit [Variovorax sp. dw_954]|uniref:efflux RND transporter periplasmic adaptor subunit n=1 Tax=Variovorax sp. dw_954 TaxID=2720078 RepID=UPI002116B1BB|nr:efflux RND transporter periplasmic adaptor subunit [Variovorax sp. dw_954]